MQQSSKQQINLERRRGFTLAELVFAAGISLFVLMVALGLLVTMLKSEAKNYNNISMDQEANEFLTYLTRDVQAASEVLTASDSVIELELRRFSSGATSLEYVGYYLRKINGGEDYYMVRELTDASGAVSQKEFFKLDGHNGAIGMINMKAQVQGTAVEYDTTFYDTVREITSEADEVRFISWEFPLHYEASNMTFSRKVTSPLIMLRNKSS